MKSEATIQGEILLALSQAGHRAWRANAGEVRTQQGYVVKLLPKGFPDIFGYRKDDGKFFAIEVKNSKGRLRDEQKRFKSFAETQPILYGVARSVDDALKILKETKE